MRKFSAEEQVAAMLRSLVLDTQFELDALRKDMAVFALIVWVAVARKLQRELRRSRGLSRIDGLGLAEAAVGTKFRVYESRLSAQIEGILLARKQKFSDEMLRITGDARFTKSAKVKVSELRFMELTMHETFMSLLRNFQQRLVLQLRTVTIQDSTTLSSVSGPALSDAEDVYDRLGGAFPADDFPNRKRIVEDAQTAALKTGPVARFTRDIGQMVGDFSHTGLMDTIWPLLTQSSSVSGLAAIVIRDEKTSDFCTGLIGGMWDAATGKPLPDSAVRVDFPGPPPYHRFCRTIMAPIFHQGLTFKSGATASGDAPELSEQSWQSALPKNERKYGTANSH